MRGIRYVPDRSAFGENVELKCMQVKVFKSVTRIKRRKIQVVIPELNR